MQAYAVAAWRRRLSLIAAMILLVSGTLCAQSSTAAASPAGSDLFTLVPPAVTPPPAPAAPEAAAPPATAGPPATVTSSPAVPATAWMDSGISMIKTVGAVGLVICLILAGSILFRKIAPQYMSKRPNERILKLVETLSIGDKRSILLVQAGNKRLLLAGTPSQVTLLTPLSEGAPHFSTEAVEPVEDEVPAASSASFRNLYELEKKAPPVRPSARHTLPPDIRGKMRELRKALEG